MSTPPRPALTVRPRLPEEPPDVSPVVRHVDPRPVDAAFDDYVAMQRHALVRYATLLCGSPVQAEDLVQDVLVRLYPRWGSLTDPHPYVRRCITNEFLSWRRRWSTRNVHVLPDAALDRPVDQRWDDGPDPELWALLTTLPGQQRAAVVLRYWEGLGDAEIGVVLGCKPGSVRAHLSRGLARLRGSLTSPTTGRTSTEDDDV